MTRGFADATRGAVHHGGDTDAARRRFGDPPDGWLDLSTGISPWPYPFVPPASDAWSRLPGELALASLRIAAAERYGAPSPDCVTPLPGTQALLQLLPLLQPPTTVAVLSPTYEEHAATWAAGGHRVVEAATLDDAERAAPVVVVTNPNNPDGRTQEPARLAALADALASRGGWLIVDEAFADVAPGVSLATGCDRPHTIMLRSFGKFHGLAGLRLGFALTDPALAQELRAALGPWAVSGPAIEIGRQALSDEAWQVRTRARLSDMATRLDAVLREAGLAVVGGTDLFRLAEIPSAAEVHERLGTAGILARTFQRNPHWLRFGLPPDGPALDRLAAALR